MRTKTKDIAVEIKGRDYSASVERGFPPENPKICSSIKVVIDPRNQDCSEIDKIPEGSVVEITDKSLRGDCSGDYIYKGANPKERIFDSK